MTLAYRFTSNYATLCLMNIRVSRKISVLPSGTFLPKLCTSKNWPRHAIPSIQTIDSRRPVVDNTWQRRRAVVNAVNIVRRPSPSCWSHSASNFVYSAMVDWAQVMQRRVGPSASIASIFCCTNCCIHQIPTNRPMEFEKKGGMKLQNSVSLFSRINHCSGIYSELAEHWAMPSWVA